MCDGCIVCRDDALKHELHAAHARHRIVARPPEGELRGVRPASGVSPTSSLNAPNAVCLLQFCGW